MANERTIGEYRIIAPIGVGSSATVYRAIDEVNGYEVAIKVLAENLSLLPDSRQRFVDEINLLSAVDSRSVAQIYEVGETEGGQPYMVLELADRGDLRRRLEDFRRDGRSVNWHDLWVLGEHLHEALSSLHQQGIVHRDVSPGNILIQHREELVEWTGSALLESGERFILTDLGFAKDLEWASGLTAGGGTRGFASPEQQNEVTVVDHRSDIFSASAVIDWTVFDSPFAEALDKFLKVGLSEEPEDRFADIGEWYDTFIEALDSAPADEAESRISGWALAAVVYLVGLVFLGLVFWATGLLDNIF